MNLPEKEYFTVDEIAIRWNCNEDQIFHYFKNGILHPAIDFRGITGELWIDSSPGDENSGKLLDNRYVLNEIVYLWDYNKLKRKYFDFSLGIDLDGEILVFEFQKPNKWLKVVPSDVGGYIIEDEHFLITKYERDRFEHKYNINILKSTIGKKGDYSMVSNEGTIKMDYDSKQIWKEIEKEYNITKRAFARKINFVTDKFKREIIFRDIGHSYFLAFSGLSKPSVILAGGIIEELLRLYLQHKDVPPSSKNFNGYIKTCEDNGLLKTSISRLSDSVRHFRNLVHLEEEKTKRYTISMATAKGAISSIFTIANDF